MKRIALILLGAIISVSAYAQIFTTTSSFQTIETTPKIHPKFEFYGKIGANIMSADFNALDSWGWGNKPDGTISCKTKFGVDVAFGLISHFRPSNPSNFYWGAEIGISQVGGGYDEFTSSGSGVRYYPSTSFADLCAGVSPTIGWEKEVADNISIDLHLNPGVLFKFKTRTVDNYINNVYYDYEIDPVPPIKAFIKGGIGVWINRINVDLSYRNTLFDVDSHVNYSNVIISLGYRF